MEKKINTKLEIEEDDYDYSDKFIQNTKVKFLSSKTSELCEECGKIDKLSFVDGRQICQDCKNNM